MKEKIKTIFLVIILSCLIWVLAERAVIKETKVRATLVLTNDHEDLLVQYLDDQRQPSENINQPIDIELHVEGPAGVIQAVQGKTFNLNIPLDMTKYAPHGQPSPEYTLWITDDLLQRHLTFEGHYLLVTNSDPVKLDIRVTQLVKQPLPITVYDSDGVKLDVDEINPPTYDTFVIEGSQPKASVILTPEQVNIARQALVKVTGTVPLPGNQNRQFDVSLRLPKSESDWQVKDIMVPRLGIVKSLQMEQKWQVVVNPDALKEYTPIRCRGTAQAVKEFTASEHHLILSIKDDDSKETDIYRPPQYLIPKGFEGKLEILNPKQNPIRFKLVPIKGTSTATP